MASSKFANFEEANKVLTINGEWQVKFDAKWGGLAKPVKFSSLQDWTLNESEGIKYYSGTANYVKLFDIDADQLSASKNALYLDLGIVNHIDSVVINGKALGGNLDSTLGNKDISRTT